MKRSSSENSGTGKLLDAWTPPKDAGEALGCVATTFTFKAEFFEEECLGRFIELQTDPAEDGPAYLIEREEKLAQLVCAVVLVDQQHARNLIRSLRWDVLVARPAQGIMHAKVSLLQWTIHTRLIVASANLTDDGYRRNLEIFGVLDFHEGSGAPLEVLDASIGFLHELAATAGQEGAASQRWEEFLAQVTKQTRTWGATKAPRGAGAVRMFPVFSGPGRSTVLETLEGIKIQTDAFTNACVISPFFDPPEAQNVPAQAIWLLLKQRGEAAVEYHVPVEEIPGEEAVQVHAPQSLLTFRPDDTSIRKLILESSRPLHAKCLSLENARSILRVIGSSNFTSAGLGLGKIKNWEANLGYLVHRASAPSAAKALEASWPNSTELPDDYEVRYLPTKNEEEAESGALMLPRAFGEAVFACPDSGPEIRLHFQGTPPPGWKITIVESNEFFTSDTDWQAQGNPEIYVIPWTKDRPPSGFAVSWSASIGEAWWPVNSLDGAALPPPLELKDLKLDLLVELLTSTRPLYVVLASWARRREKVTSPNSATDPLLDPHRRVNTSAFLLQRTRRVSAALYGLRKRLERPFASEASLHWRLRGPIGVLALAEAISREADNEVERTYLLLELCLELRRTGPGESPGSLSVRRVRTALREIITEMEMKMSSDAFKNDPALAEYAQAALKKVKK